MKNFDDIEQLWRQQAVAVHGSPKAIHAVESAAERVVKSGRRLLRWGVAILVFSLVVGQLLAVVSFVHGDRTPNAVAVVHHLVVQAIQILLLIGLVRRIRADRELRAKSASSVRENLELSLELIEREMRDYGRMGPVFAVLLILDAVSLVNGYHLGYFDQAGLAGRLISIAAFFSVVAAVALRHVRRVLVPRRKELRSVLTDLDGG